MKIVVKQHTFIGTNMAPDYEYEVVALVNCTRPPIGAILSLSTIEDIVAGRFTEYTNGAADIEIIK
ncbi:hypothetical protein LCGC14_1391150 [marine sediment metagenome]|uniref:Uncharacterized protein n=1 Tax=marine sediment metagenome TaxID=412755 RepID=A0A0F9JZY7_9ZZZZ